MEKQKNQKDTISLQSIDQQQKELKKVEKVIALPKSKR